MDGKIAGSRRIALVAFIITTYLRYIPARTTADKSTGVQAVKNIVIVLITAFVRYSIVVVGQRPLVFVGPAAVKRTVLEVRYVLP